MKLSRLFGVSYKTDEEIAENLSNKELRDQLKRFMTENEHLKNNIDRVLTCPICNEMKPFQEFQ